MVRLFQFMRGCKMCCSLDSQAACGEEACGVLARGFCHKMQDYLNAELADPSLEGRPSGEDIHVEYEESPEVANLVRESTKGGSLEASCADSESFQMSLCVRGCIIHCQCKQVATTPEPDT